MNIGVDIVAHDRVKLSLAKKILTQNENEQLEKITNHSAKIEYVASRFAAKEAIIKATNKKYVFKEIEVIRTEGAPKVNIEGINLSLSHEKENSIAFCVYKGE